MTQRHPRRTAPKRGLTACLALYRDAPARAQFAADLRAFARAAVQP